MSSKDKNCENMIQIIDKDYLTVVPTGWIYQTLSMIFKHLESS